MKHLAHFSISADLVRNRPELVRELMTGMLVLEARYNWAVNCIQYLADSPEFPQTEEFIEAPELFIRSHHDAKPGGRNVLVKLTLETTGDNPAVYYR